MPDARANRGDDMPTPEPDAPIRRAMHGTSRRSATLSPVAGSRAPVPAWAERLLQQELERLLGERLDDAEHVAIAVDGGCITLRGRVSCPLVRLLAEDLVFSRSEVIECRNELVVRPTHDASLAA